jgi:hypothetical protein
VAGIVEHERFLMEGLNYEFRCHHPYSAMHALALDFTTFMSKHSDADSASVDDQVEELLERASAIVQRASIFSDVHFLFAPGHIGFAVIAIALGGAADGCISDRLHQYLRNRFSRKPRAELDDFLNIVSRIVKTLYRCPLMDLSATDRPTRQVVAQRAEVMKRALGRVASLRLHLHHRRGSSGPGTSRKRSRVELDFTPPRKRLTRVSAKVTPVCHH